MEYSKLVEIIENERLNKKNNLFKIILSDGSSQILRLFVSMGHNMICSYNKRSVRYGTIIPTHDYKEWKEIKPYGKNTWDDVTIVRRFLKNVIKYITISGLWNNILQDYNKLLSMSDDELKNRIHNYNTENRNLFHCDSILRSAKKGIVSINYLRYEREEQRTHIKNILNKKKDYTYCWRKDYDNSIQITYFPNDNLYKAWYATEYKGCGNGHYYLMLDERHAIFCETD